MMSLVEIQRKIIKLKEQRNKIIETRLDGRTQTWLCGKAGFSPMNLSNALNADFSEEEIIRVDTALNGGVKVEEKS